MKTYLGLLLAVACSCSDLGGHHNHNQQPHERNFDTGTFSSFQPIPLNFQNSNQGFGQFGQLQSGQVNSNQNQPAQFQQQPQFEQKISTFTAQSNQQLPNQANDQTYFAPQQPHRFQSQVIKENSQEQYKILRDDRENVVGNKFKYVIELEGGTMMEQEGTEGVNGTTVITGSYRYVSPEGETIEVKYVADENGFRPESNSIPVPPPVPDFVRAQIAAQP